MVAGAEETGAWAGVGAAVEVRASWGRVGTGWAVAAGMAGGWEAAGDWGAAAEVAQVGMGGVGEGVAGLEAAVAAVAAVAAAVATCGPYINGSITMHKPVEGGILLVLHDMYCLPQGGRLQDILLLMRQDNAPQYPTMAIQDQQGITRAKAQHMVTIKRAGLS